MVQQNAIQEPDPHTKPLEFPLNNTIKPISYEKTSPPTRHYLFVFLPSLLPIITNRCRRKYLKKLTPLSNLLKEHSPNTPTHFKSTYSSNDKEIILDPGGYNIHLQISGDSLIWKGGLPVSRDYISLKKTGPVVRMK
jgi:hypothetical protein